MCNRGYRSNVEKNGAHVAGLLDFDTTGELFAYMEVPAVKAILKEWYATREANVGLPKVSKKLESSLRTFLAFF